MSNTDLRSFVDRLERLESEIKEMNSDKADVYTEAKGSGLDVKALKTVIARRRKDPSELTELDQIVETYEASLLSGTVNAPPARTRTTTPQPKPPQPAIAPPVAAHAISAPADDAGPMPEFLQRRQA